MCGAGQNAFIDEFALMGLEAVPNKHDRHPQLLLQVLEEVHGTLAVDVGICMKSKVQSDPIAAGRNAQCGDGGYFLKTAPTLSQHRRLSTETPRATHEWGHEHPGFVEKNDCRSQAGGVFFTRGQSWSIQAWIRSSSRSRARRVGFWGENPSPCNRRLTWAG